MNGIGLALSLLFAVCGAGIVLGLILPQSASQPCWRGLALCLRPWRSGHPPDRRGAFPHRIRRERDETHVVDRVFLWPIGAAVRQVAAFLAGMHHGRLNAYVTYTLVFLLLALLLFRVI